MRDTTVFVIAIASSWLFILGIVLLDTFQRETEAKNYRVCLEMGNPPADCAE